MKDVMNELKEYISYNLDKLSYNEIIDLVDSYNLSNKQKTELLKYVKQNIYNYNYSTDIVKNYLKEISKYPTLSYDELKELYIKMQNNDSKARETIINCNLKFVVLIAKKYMHYGLSFMDLIEEGNLGLIKAVDMYNYKLGYKFTTYAVFWIKAYIINSIYNKDFKIDKNVQVKIRKIQICEEELIKKLNRFPTYKEISDYYNQNNSNNITEVEIKILMEIDRRIISLNMIINSGDKNKTELINLLDSNNEDVSNEALRNISYKNIRDILNGKLKSNLTEQEKRILLLRFGFNGKPHSLSEISTIIGVTKERIRQVEGKALRKLKTYKYTKNLINNYD